MSRSEAEIWSIFVGVLVGMLIQFRFWFDIDFFRAQWPVMMAILIGWFVVRDLICGRKCNAKGKRV